MWKLLLGSFAAVLAMLPAPSAQITHRARTLHDAAFVFDARSAGASPASSADANHFPDFVRALRGMVGGPRME